MKATSVALVTARGGSKRLPRKNLLPLAGRPLIEWSIKAALAAQSVRRVIVSTDDAELMDCAREAGAEVPFRRPDELSGDTSSHYDVIRHAIGWLASDEGEMPDSIFLLQPTSPLRTHEDIDGLVWLVESTGADSGFTVSPVDTHPAHVFRVDEGSFATPLVPRGEGYVRSQDLEPLYRENGAGYLLKPESFFQRTVVLGPAPVAYVMPAERSIDIDTELDFTIAAALLARQSCGDEQ